MDFRQLHPKRLWSKTSVKATLLLVLLASITFGGIALQDPDLSKPQDYKEYISAFTSGQIYRSDLIRVSLNFESEIAGSPGTEADPDLLRFSPAIKGKLVWKTKRMLEFIPEEKLVSGQSYFATLNLRELNRDVPRKLRKFTFKFAVRPQTVAFVSEGFRPYHYNDKTLQYLQGYIQLNDIPDTAGLEKVLSARIGGKQLPVTIFRYDPDDYSGRSSSYRYTFNIDSVQRGQEDRELEVYIDGTAVGGDQKVTQTVEVPSMGDFSTEDVSVINDPEQYVNIRFTDPIRPNQNLAGIISIDGEANPRIVIDENIVRVYPAKALVGTYLLRISSGIRNAWNFNMNEPETHELEFRPLNPNVRISSKGVILPSSGKWLFPFEAVNVKAVHVTIYRLHEKNVLQFLQVNELEGQRELYRVASAIMTKRVPLKYTKVEELSSWKNYAIDLNNIIRKEPGAMYRVQIAIHKEDAIIQCNESSENEETYEEYSDRQSEDWGWDYPWDSDQSYNENPCGSYFFPRLRGHNVMASDLGIIAKADPDLNYHFFIHDLTSTQPLPGATVTLYDYQQQVVWSGPTDQAGMATASLKKTPFVAVVSYGNQKGYLKLDQGSTLSISNFDVSGVHNKKGLKGFLYGERGVWRPGDSIYLTFILEDKLNQIPADYPVTMELYDPQGQLVKKQQQKNPVHDFYDFRTATESQAPTGNWLAKVKIGNQSFTKTLKIETVKPNRLKIYMEFPDDQLSRSNPKDSGHLRVKWLHGAPAPGLKAEVEANVYAGQTRFKDFPNICFDDPVRQFSSEQVTVFSGNLNASGEQHFKSNLNLGDEAPGMLRASFNTRVYEDGGNFSVDRFSVNYSPFASYAGLGVPENRSVLSSSDAHDFKVVRVSEKGRALPGKVEIKIYKLDWRWWWDRYDDDLNYYLSRAGIYPVADSTLNLASGQTIFRWKSPQNEWGRYLIRVKDLESGHMSGKIIFFDSPYWSRENSTHSEFATMLTFSTDKSAYKVGENIKISIPSPGKGKALVSVENGQRILKKFWVDAKPGATKVEIPTTPDMAPNCFVFVSLIQPHGQVQNDLPIRLYGIMQVKVENPESHLEPLIAMADVLQPESKASVTIREAKGRAMTYTLALVDEGLLDLTRFKTPNPWDEFYASEALGVKTWDLHDWVINAYRGNLNSILSIGGDGALLNGQGAKANRFPPVVRFLGPFHLAAGGKQTHQVQLPAYVGSMRVMVVAGENRAYGAAEKTVAVKKPLMVLTTLPRVLGPGETIGVPVNVFAMDDRIKDVKVSLEVSSNLQLSRPSSQNLHFYQQGDEISTFQIKVPMELGVAKVKVKAVSGNDVATEEVEIAIRPSGPMETESFMKELKPGEEWEFPVNLTGLNGSNQLEVEAAYFPVNIGKRLQYLIHYPHGCVEQTTSAAFPQLALLPLSTSDPKAQQRMVVNIKAAIQRLRYFQTSSGGMAYWPGQSSPDDWGTNYAGHFMLEAERMGYTLPVNWKTRWIKYQQQKARNWQSGDELTNSYRLYTLALAGSPELGAMNRMLEHPKLGETAKWRLAAAYALAGQTSTAQKLVDQLDVKHSNYIELAETYGSETRDEAMVMETLLLLNDKVRAAQLLQRIGTALRSNDWMSTQTTAYALLSAVKYMQSQPSDQDLGLSWAWADQQGTLLGKGFAKTIVISGAPVQQRNLKLKNNGKGVVFVQVNQSGYKLPGEEKPVEKNLKLTVKYIDKEGKALAPQKLAMGTEFTAEVTVNNPSAANLDDIALTQIFPSGWEIRNVRMEEGEGGVEQSLFTYQDVRDDRVMTYFDMNRTSEVTYKVKLIATYAGRYYLSSPEVEVMYDNNYFSKAKGSWVEVIPATPMGN